MIEEIEQEFNVIRLCLSELQELDQQYQAVLDRIIVMPLRKLLCEKSSVLLKICPEFKMPPLKGFVIELEDGQYIIHTPLCTEKIETWIPVQDWLKQYIAWFDRDARYIAQMLPKFSYECILNKLSGKFKGLKNEFTSFFICEKVEYKGDIMDVYVKKDPEDAQKNQRIYEILEQIGYNKLSVYDYLKHISDKRGAHIDVGHSLVIQLVNYADKQGMTPIYYMGIQMIYAAKKQIPELQGYWKEMPCIETEG
jgi:hypothetical protein